MAGGGLDDELLALAGGSDDDVKSSSKRTPFATNDNDQVDDDNGNLNGSSRKRSAKSTAAASSSSSSLAKRRRLDLLDESDLSDEGGPRGDRNAAGSDQDAQGSDLDAPGSSEEDQDDIENANPYPYQGIYKSVQDMQELMNMNELEREDILARRRDELNKRRQKIELANLVRAQKAAAGATKKSSSSIRQAQQMPKKKKKVVRGGAKSSSSRRRGARGGLDDDEDDDLTEQDSDDQQDDDAGSDFEYTTSGAASAAKSRKKKLVGQTDAKSAKLSELRNRRKEKAAGISSRRPAADSDDDDAPSSKPTRRHAGYGSSSDDDDDYSDSEEEIYGRKKSASRRSRTTDDYAAATSSSSSSKEPPTLADLNAARISRDSIEQRLYAPRWKETLTGAFIKFSWGSRPKEDGRGQETVYRIHQITDVIEKPGKFYDLSPDGSGKWTNVYLAFEHGGNEFEAKLNMLSRSEFTESERERWIRTLAGNGQKVPRASSVIAKGEQLEKFFTSPLTEADIGLMLSHKKQLRIEAMSVMGKRAGGVGGGSEGFSTPKGTDSPIPGLHRVVQPTPASTLEEKLKEVNERNRQLDRTKMSDVERRARNNKLAQAQAQAEAAKAAGTPNGSSDLKNGTGADAKSKFELTNQAPGTTGMGNGFVQVKNLATTVEVDLGDF